MSDDEKSLPLRRKLRAPSNPLGQPGLSAPKLLRLAFARACENTAGFEAAVTGFAENKVNLSQLTGELSETDLILATTSKTNGGGLAIFDGPTLAVMMGQMITGRYTGSPPGDHVPTKTDAAVMGIVLDSILAEFESELTQLSDAPPVSGFRKSGMFHDGRAVSMAMKEIPYRHYRLALTFGGGTINGTLQLLFPWENSRNLNSLSSIGGSWHGHWRNAISQTTAPVSAILYRMSLQLNEIKQLEVGTTLPIPLTSIGRVSLEGSDQSRVAFGRLGQSNGHRAVKVVLANGGADNIGIQDSFENTQPDHGELPDALHTSKEPLSAAETSTAEANQSAEIIEGSGGLTVE